MERNDVIKFDKMKVKVTLINDFYYIGEIQKLDKRVLEMIDKNGRMVTIIYSSIKSIQEVK